MAKRLAIAGLVLLALYFGYTKLLMRPSASGRGGPIDLDREPQQSALAKPELVPVERDGQQFVIEKLQHYEITGQVLSVASYDIAWTNEFFDVDVGLIWGPRRAELQQKYHFNQNGRWLFWRSETQVTDVERAYITSHISNNHLIPAEGRRNVAKAISWLSRGDRVRIVGALVAIKRADGSVMSSSSQSRDDTGNGACEIVWVDEIQINDAVYR